MDKIVDVLVAVGTAQAEPWLDIMQRALPHARVRAWTAGDRARADYLLAWKCAPQALAPRDGLKAIFNLGAGVDALLAILRAQPEHAMSDAPIYRLEDAGMAAQMVDYARYGVLHHLRRFGDYRSQAARGEWLPLPARQRRDMPVGVLGLGQLGEHVARALAADGFIVRGYSRSAKTLDGIETFAAETDANALDAFLDGLQVVINLLPATAGTRHILCARTFARMASGACVINLARGMHVNENDLLAALDANTLSFALLDVFEHEPLDAAHAFWRHERVIVTPHISAATLIDESAQQVAEKISSLEAGRAIGGRVDTTRGY